MFPHSETFSLDAEGVRRFAKEFLLSDNKTYAIMIGGQGVDDDDHLLQLADGLDEVAIEFRHVDPEEGQTAAEIHAWLRHVGHRIG